MTIFSFADAYERHLVDPLFRPFAEVTLDRLAPAPGERLLDVACGTGIVARLASERMGGPDRVVGVDVSPEMIAVAARTAPALEWREGDATALPLADGERYDVVVCQQGLQFMADRAAAARELRRATRDGGRLAVSTWRPLDETELFPDLQRVAERHVGPIVDRRHGFGDAKTLQALLRDAGFGDVQVSTFKCAIRFEDGPTFLRMNAMALVGMSGASKTLSDEARGRTVELIAAECRDAAARHLAGDHLVFELGTNLAIAAG